ncbi:AraC family transcriptional regulator [Parapedobacter soli]|uniref:AraC family transcriptional regulator n=1 Tax=Parapedobacter soli TaxID=416955 RepID=UPI0021C7C93A|nr:AraC family transcriptional regulator [Parapedobacter soli]
MRISSFNVPKTNSESFWVDDYKGRTFFSKLHVHPEIQITLIKKATGDVLSGGHYGRFYTGEVYVIGSNIPHVFRSDGDVEPTGENALSIIFKPDFLGEHFLALPECEVLREWLGNTQHCMKIKPADSIEISAAIERAAESWGFDKILHFTKLLHLCVNTAYTVLAPNAKKVYNESETKTLDKILQFTFSNFKEEVTIDKVADLACMSPASFCRYFKSKTQKTYIQFLNEVRIANACKLLMDRDVTIAESAHQSGYNNLTYFNRKFKYVMNLTPSSYIKVIEKRVCEHNNRTDHA